MVFRIRRREWGAGTEGNSEMEIFRNEVDMTTPYPENDTFTVVSSTPVLPEGFLNSEQYQGLTEEQQKSFLIRGEAHTELQLPDLDYSIYGAARRMQYVTMEEDRLYPGEDRQLGNGDDGRSIMLAYEDIPFKINQGTKAMMGAIGGLTQIGAVGAAGGFKSYDAANPMSDETSKALTALI